MKSTVNVIKSSYNNVFEKLIEILCTDGLVRIRSGDKVVIKINLCDARTPETGTITHPLFIDGLLKYLRENYENLDITLVESDATVVLADEFIKWFGYLPILEKWNVKFVNLSKTKYIEKKLPGKKIAALKVPTIISEADCFITVPKPKTNPMSMITCSLKNQFGCLPDVEKNLFHPYLDEAIVWANKLMRPTLTIVDGITAMGGAQGPAFGTPLPWNTIVVSHDPVATDAFVARSMGLNPRFIGHIRKAAALKVGSMDYVVNKIGSLDKHFDFETSGLELRLIKFASVLQRRAQKKVRNSGY